VSRYSSERRFVMFVLGLVTIFVLIDGVRFGWLT
jgi:hypothetical protein